MDNKFYAKLHNNEYIKKVEQFLKNEGGFVYFNYNTYSQLLCIIDKFNYLKFKKFNYYHNRLIMNIFDNWVVFCVLN